MEDEVIQAIKRALPRYRQYLTLIEPPARPLISGNHAEHGGTVGFHLSGIVLWVVGVISSTGVSTYCDLGSGTGHHGVASSCIVDQVPNNQTGVILVEKNRHRIAFCNEWLSRLPPPTPRLISSDYTNTDPGNLDYLSIFQAAPLFLFLNNYNGIIGPEQTNRISELIDLLCPFGTVIASLDPILTQQPRWTVTHYQVNNVPRRELSWTASNSPNGTLPTIVIYKYQKTDNENHSRNRLLNDATIIDWPFHN